MTNQYDEKSKERLRTYPISSDTELGTHEKNTSINVIGKRNYCRIQTEIPVHIRWVLSLDESEILSHRLQHGAIVALRAKVPKGVIKLQGSTRKAQTNGAMVSYGPLETETGEE